MAAAVVMATRPAAAAVVVIVVAAVAAAEAAVAAVAAAPAELPNLPRPATENRLLLRFTLPPVCQPIINSWRNVLLRMRGFAIECV